MDGRGFFLAFVSLVPALHFTCHTLQYNTYLVAPPVDARNINGHVNHVAAQLVGGHVHRVEVGRYVNPRDYVEQERFLHHAVLFRSYWV